MRYFVNATNDDETEGERPLIEADSPEEAVELYYEYGGKFPVRSVDVA